MPLYVYKREDGTKFEITQSIKDEALTVCPKTGQKVERVIFAVPSHFRGSGFYQTDYKDKKKSNK